LKVIERLLEKLEPLGADQGVDEIGQEAQRDDSAEDEV
jgi:hypothetical protein